MPTLNLNISYVLWKAILQTELYLLLFFPLAVLL